jgi:hypothetical protein
MSNSFEGNYIIFKLNGNGRKEGKGWDTEKRRAKARPKMNH